LNSAEGEMETASVWEREKRREEKRREEKKRLGDGNISSLFFSSLQTHTHTLSLCHILPSSPLLLAVTVWIGCRIDHSLILLAGVDGVRVRTGLYVLLLVAIAVWAHREVGCFVGHTRPGHCDEIGGKGNREREI
jgi:hypothetical protein